MREALPYVGAVIPCAHVTQEHARDAAALPCLVVLVDERADRSDVLVGVCAIVDSAPPSSLLPVALDRRVRSELRLGSRRWVVTHELHTFLWGRTRRPPTPHGTQHYGQLPPKVTREVKGALLRNGASDALARVASPP